MAKQPSAWVQSLEQQKAFNSALANAKARKKMSPMERDCGITIEQFDAFQAEQRARVRKRWLS